MRQKRIFPIIFIPFLYVAIIGLLVFLQFSGGSLFNMSLGPLQLSGSFEMGKDNQPERVASIQIRSNGLQFLFDDRHPLVIQDRNGTSRKLLVSSCDTLESGYRIMFERNVALEFSFLDDQRQVLQITVQPSRDLLPLKAVRIPLISPSLDDARVLNNPPGLLYRQDGADFLLGLPPRSFIDTGTSMLVIPGDASKTLHLARNENKPDNILAGFTPSSLASISPKDYRTTLSEYLTAAYQSWKGSRYNSAAGTWSNRDDESRFDENVMVALLAEAWNRDEYTRVFNEMRSCADIHPDKVSWRSGVFLGGLRRLTNQMGGADRQESERLRLLISQKDVSLLSEPGLYQFAIDRGEKYLAPELLNYIDSLDPSQMDTVSVLGLLQNLYLNENNFADLESRIPRFESLIKERIVTSIVRTVEGYYLMVNERQSSTYHDILAGRILQEYGRREGDENMAALGQALVLSVVKLADEQAYIPAWLDISAGAIAGVNKSLAPEDTYWLLNNNPAWPRKVSLQKELGPGHWFYTLAQINSVSIKPTEYRFDISYPRERTHYLFFRGIPNIDPQKGMQLFGIVWRNDPNFEVWSKGRYYNPDTETLVIKYYHDSIRNDIILWPK